MQNDRSGKPCEVAGSTLLMQDELLSGCKPDLRICCSSCLLGSGSCFSQLLQLLVPQLCCSRTSFELLPQRCSILGEVDLDRNARRSLLFQRCELLMQPQPICGAAVKPLICTLQLLLKRLQLTGLYI